MNSHKFYSTSTYHFTNALSLSLSLSLSYSLFSLMVFMVVSSFFYRCYIVNNTWTTTALLTYIRHKCISSWVDYTFKSYHRTCKNDTCGVHKRLTLELHEIIQYYYNYSKIISIRDVFKRFSSVSGNFLMVANVWRMNGMKQYSIELDIIFGTQPINVQQ